MTGGSTDNPAIVVLGGGTGLATLLSGLKNFTSNLTAVVTVADDGGSSGRLRREMGILPPGDIRNCLVALAEDESLMGRLFQYRFEEGEGPLSGHCFGNLFLAALTKVTDDFEEAVRLSSKILKTRGTVLPASLDLVWLKAELDDGTLVEGQSAIAGSNRCCRHIWLEPEDARPTSAVMEAIAKAEIIVAGPGSLFTSILPNLLIREITEAVAAAGCPRVFICNVMTQPGETMGFSAADHLEALVEHTQAGIVDSMLVNTAEPPAPVVEFYRAKGALPVVIDRERLESAGVNVIYDDVASGGNYFRHDSGKLAAAVMALL
ncbi:MAG: gluconeogenesis factor YvcK family protein [Thermoleophilia bacterium]